MSIKKTKGFQMTQKEKDAAAKRVKEDMKKHGFKSLKAYMEYIEKKRGY